MANWVIELIDAESGAALTQGQVTGWVDTVPQSGCGGFLQPACASGGPGYPVNIPAPNGDQNGYNSQDFIQNIPYQCKQVAKFTATAPGYATAYATNSTGFITGDVVQLIQIAKAATSQGVQQSGNTVTQNPNPEGSGQASVDLNGLWNGLTGEIASLGWIVLGIVALIAVILIVFAILVSKGVV